MLIPSLFFILACGIIFIFFTDSQNSSLLRIISLSTTSLSLLISTILIFYFDLNCSCYQYVTTFSITGSSLLNIEYSFGFDGISLFFFVLSSLLIFICNVFSWKNKYLKELMLSLLVIELFLLVVFSVLDLFLFYIFFEAILIPMFLLIGIWGSRERKIRAVYLFFFYTLCGSILMLVGILYIYLTLGTLNFEYLYPFKFSKSEQIVLWLCFFLSFASKIPMFPFHVWLPEAHVEAPTVGSVLLAGVLLKLGVYGFIRFSITLFPEASLFFSPLVFVLGLLGVIYASLTAIRQTDLKRIIAYSSIAHMNLVAIGIFSFNLFSLEGALLQSISHGFVSGGLFFLIGILYDRYHSRLLYYYSGIVHIMPIYSIFFFLFTLSNIALPGTGGFPGEFLLLIGLYESSLFTCFLGSLSVVLCGTYSLWLYNRVFFGNLKTYYITYYNDMNIKDFIILLPLLLCNVLVGIYPIFFLSFLHLECMTIPLTF